MYHQIVLQARSNTLSLLPRAFTQIIFVGQQYGSILGNNLVAKYPTDVDALVLTGYSSSYVISGLIVAASLIPAPAALIAGQHKWANLHPAYFTSSSASGYDADFFWAPGRDPAISAETFMNRDTVALGILVTFEVGVEHTNYAGPVYLASGQRDQLDCRALGLIALAGSLLGAPPDCGTATSGSVAQTKSLFPHASSIDVYIVPNSGLDWQLHYNALTAFNTVHAVSTPRLSAAMENMILICVTVDDPQGILEESMG
jgi:pimeloyl-ACP methyl ester carboxylesterase